MKRVTYKQRGDESVVFEIKSTPSKAGSFRRRFNFYNSFRDSFDKYQEAINKRSLNNQEGEE